MIFVFMKIVLKYGIGVFIEFDGFWGNLVSISEIFEGYSVCICEVFVIWI